MDLVVNGPYKAAIRRKRCTALFGYFQSWKILRLQEMAKEPSARDLPPFAPPKPDIVAGLLNSFEVERQLFNTESFRAAVRRTFVAAGQAPDAEGNYIVYKSPACSTIAKILLPEGKVEEAGAALASVIGTGDTLACDDDDEPETDEEVEGDE